MIKLAIVNQSTVVPDADFKQYILAQDLQLKHDFSPIWGIDTRLYYSSDIHRVPSGAWVLLILDDSDQANALGYHYESPQGLPLGKVFAKTDKQNNLQWTVTASHETLELLVNPWVDKLTITSGPLGIRLWAYEVCDAVESDNLAYKINDVWMSDFVYPNYFQPDMQGPYDKMNAVHYPLVVTQGGYMSVMDTQAGQWTMEGMPQRHPDESSRRARLLERIS